MALPVQHFFQIGCPENALSFRTAAVALTEVHEDPTKGSFSSLAIASDENEKHFTYLESSIIEKGSHQLVLFVDYLLLLVTCKRR